MLKWSYKDDFHDDGAQLAGRRLVELCDIYSTVLRQVICELETQLQELLFNGKAEGYLMAGEQWEYSQH